MDNNRKNNKIIYNNFGKVPPNAIDLEKAILGAILLEKDAFQKAYELLRPEYFYTESHKRIFKSFERLSKLYHPIDTLTVVEDLRNSEELELIGGGYYLIQLTNGVFSSANIQTYSRIILEKHIQRELIRIGSNGINDAYEDRSDVFELIDNLESELKIINRSILDTKKINIEKISFSVISDLTDRVYMSRNKIENTKDVYTGFPDWDRINGALFNGLFVIAARPAMGKSTHLVELACRMGKRYKVGIINGEMTNKQLLIRIGCNLKNINNFLWKRNPDSVTDEELQLVSDAMDSANELNLLLDDHTNIDKVVNKIKIWVEEEGAQVILVDVLSKFKVSEDKKRYMNDLQEINYVLNEFDSCTRRFGVPIILYAHLNRELYKRGSKEPNLSDLKGSGNIEDFAFQVSFLHRPEYYEPDVLVDENGEDIKGLCYQMIAKHRDGETGKIKYKARLAYSQMKEWESEHNHNQIVKSGDPF